MSTSVTAPVPFEAASKLSEEAVTSEGADKATEGKQAKSLSALAIELVQSRRVELFHTPDEQPYATLEIGDHFETHSIGGAKFQGWLKRLMYQTYKRPLNSQALEEVIDVLSAMALYEGEPHEVHLRVAEYEGDYYLDLANDRWQVVKITSASWEILDHSPVKFRRTDKMGALPLPVHGGNINDLRDIINVRDEDWAQLLAWLVAALRPKGPFPILVLHGEQGSAKTSTARVVRSLVDPNEALVRLAPKDERDLFVSAENNWTLAYDNLSHISNALSDALCVLSTGGAYASRQLYSNDQESIMDAQRPVILTGISELLTREDLMSRAILLNLPSIPEEERITEDEFWQKFNAKQPELLGALLTAVSGGLVDYASVKLPKMPRLADFLKWGVACARALGLSQEAVIKSYNSNVDNTTALAVENSAIIDPILHLLQRSGGEVKLEATQLLEELWKYGGDEVHRNRDFPRKPNMLAKQLKREAPSLRRMGIGYESVKTSGSDSRRVHRLWMLPSEGEPKVVSSAGHKSTFTAVPGQVTQPTQVPQTEVSDRCDGSDGSLTQIPRVDRKVEIIFN
jgi:hypothetical protein